MPLYDYKCAACGKKWEAFHVIEERGREPPCKCGGEAKQLLSMPMINFDFKPFMHEHLGDTPVLIKSRKHLKEVAHSRGLKPAYFW